MPSVYTGAVPWIHWRHPSAVLVLSSCGNYKRPPNHSVVSAATSHPPPSHSLFAICDGITPPALLPAAQPRYCVLLQVSFLSCLVITMLIWEVPPRLHTPAHFENNSEIWNSKTAGNLKEMQSNGSLRIFKSQPFGSQNMNPLARVPMPADRTALMKERQWWPAPVGR